MKMEFSQILEKYRNVIDKELGNFFNSKIREVDDEFLKESYGYLKEFTLRPGKRIRPIATIMAYKSINDFNEEKIYAVSIAPELLHASSLIHDDIMDEDLLRRNKPTMHKIFEAYFKKSFPDVKYNGDLFDSFSKRFCLSMAILQGNILYSLSNSCILDSKLDERLKNRALEIFNDAYCKMNDGQAFDLLISLKEKLSEEDYIRMVLGKTASLISASIRFGAMLNNAKSSQLEALDKYSNSVALAFQIQDDVMDISKEKGKGRKPGTDIRKGNNTLLILRALQKSNGEQKQFLKKVLGNNKASEDDVERAIGIIKDTRALDYAMSYSNKKIIEAKEELKKAGLNKEGYGFFDEFADYVITRKV